MMAAPTALARLRVPLVEDNYFIAADLTTWLQNVGVEIIGPAGTVHDAPQLVNAAPARNAA